MTKSEGLSDRIRNRRIELGISQAQLSRDTGIAAPQLSRYESGANEPRPDITAKIAQALNVDLNWLITGLGEKALMQSQTFFTDLLDMKKHEAFTVVTTNKLADQLREISAYRKQIIGEVASNLFSDAIQKEFDRVKLAQAIDNLESAIEKSPTTLEHISRPFAKFALTLEETSNKENDYLNKMDDQKEKVRSILDKTEAIFKQIKKEKKPNAKNGV